MYWSLPALASSSAMSLVLFTRSRQTQIIRESRNAHQVPNKPSQSAESWQKEVRECSGEHLTLRNILSQSRAPSRRWNELPSLEVESRRLLAALASPSGPHGLGNHLSTRSSVDLKFNASKIHALIER